ncbi:hypothetical protein pb186bvf_008984 [Paramecium bursaria]
MKVRNQKQYKKIQFISNNTICWINQNQLLSQDSNIYEDRGIKFQLQGRIDQKLAQQLQQAIKGLYFIKPELVAIEINSEGGSQAQAKAIIQSIYSYADKSYAPVYTFADQIVFNSALLILASGNKVFSSKYSFLGDFGYSSRRQGYKQFIENLGIDFKYIHSGEQKVKLNNFEDLKEKDVKWQLKLQ